MYHTRYTKIIFQVIAALKYTTLSHSSSIAQERPAAAAQMKTQQHVFEEHRDVYKPKGFLCEFGASNGPLELCDERN